MNVEQVLQELRQKDFSGKFSQEDADKLLKLVNQHPCNLAIQLTLLDFAKGYWKFFPERWSIYFQAAMDKGTDCWTAQELAKLYVSAATLFSYDQNRTAQREAILKAFELDPYNWQVIIGYLGQFSDDLIPDTRIELIERISEVNPDQQIAFYVQGGYLVDYALLTGKKKYIHAAIDAYRNAIEIGRALARPNIPIYVLEEKIRDLSEKLEPANDKES